MKILFITRKEVVTYNTVANNTNFIITWKRSLPRKKGTAWHVTIESSDSLGYETTQHGDILIVPHSPSESLTKKFLEPFL